MVTNYVCLFVKTTQTTQTNYHFSPPVPYSSYKAWEGAVLGSETIGWGFKGKLDYGPLKDGKNGRLLMLLADDPLYPQVIILVRVTRVSDTEVTYETLDLEHELGFTPTPNQITTDKDNNIYLQSGGPTTCMIKVNAAMTVVTATFFEDADNVLCATLSKDHSRIGFYVVDLDGLGNDYIAHLRTSDMADLKSIIYAASNAQNPHNMETDVSGSSNDGWAFFIDRANGRIIKYSFTDPIVFGTAHAGAADEVVVAIDISGNVYAMERMKRCPANPNQIFKYPPHVPGGGLDAPTLIGIDCAINPEKPTHLDLARKKVDDDIYTTSGESVRATTGEVCRIVQGVNQYNVHQHDEYRDIFPAGPREAHT
jgi:hypothetical protein